MITKKYKLIALLLLAIFCTSCSERELLPVKYKGETQGTYFSITFFAADSARHCTAIDSILTDVDNSLSPFNPNSILSNVNNNIDCDADSVFINCFMLSKQAHQMSEEQFDPSIGPLVKAWGFWRKNSETPDSAIVDSLIRFAKFDSVYIENSKVIKKNPNIVLDFNAIAQGYTIDLIADYFLSEGIENFIIEVGGEVYAHGKYGERPWIVAVEQPTVHYNKREFISRVKLDNKAIATSGSYRKFIIKDGVKYSHTIDPKTGYPVTHSLLSVSVTADNCTMADAMATTFMVMGIDKSMEFIKKYKDYEAMFVYADSSGFKTVMTKGFEELVQE